VIRRLVEYGWPTALVAAFCLGVGAANWLQPRPVMVGGALAVATSAAGLAAGPRRLVLAALVVALAGLWWGSLRVEALSRSVLIARIGETGTARVVVTGPARHGRYSLRVPAVVRRFAGVDLREPVLLQLPDGRAPPQGAELELQAQPLAPRGPETGFDEREWLGRHGVHVVLEGRNPRIVGRRGGIGGVSDRLRRHVAAALGRGASGERLALLEGVVLGDDAGLTPELKADFKASGLYHLLAVSGQNVAFIALGVLGLCWVVGVQRSLAHVAVLIAIAAYALAVGWQPSVVRAAVAGSLASLAWLASRPSDRWHFLALGAAVLLAWNPATVFDPGFQLSFAAVAAIFVWVPWLDRRLEELPLPLALPRKLRACVAVSVACGTVTSPILWLDFRQVPLWTVVANALAEPAMGALLGLGLLAAMVDPVLPGAAAALAWLAGWAAAWIAFCARLVSRFPAAQVSSPRVLLLVAAAVAAAVGLRRLPPWRRTPAATVLVALSLLAAAGWRSLQGAHPWVSPTGLRVTFLDVGQGDAELLEVREGAILVDTGPPEAGVDRQLRRLGVRSLAAVVLTHPHRDHVGGAPAVEAHLGVGELVDPGQPAPGFDERQALAAARAASIPVAYARLGQGLRLGRLTLRVLWPDGGGRRGENPHDHAVVLLASYGATDVLLTADAESNVTSQLSLPPIEVLKVAHHGSADPGLPDLLRRLRPRIAVIEVGAHNDYGHPRASTLAALAAVPGLRLYRTDLDGRVVLESDGRSIAVRTTVE
jgi:competence protein ComEC